MDIPTGLTRTFLGMALVLLTTACAGAGGSTSGWQSVTSKRFVTYTPSLRNHGEVIRELEEQYAALASSFFKQDIGQVEVLFLEPPDFAELLGYRRRYATLPRLPGKEPGRIGRQGLIVLPRGEEGRRSISQALAHLFIHRSIPTAPLWFNEGFAAYTRLAEYHEKGDRRVVCFGKPGFSRYETFIPLDKVLTATWEDYDGDEARYWYRNSARMLIDYALHGDGGKHAPAVGVMVRGFLANQPAGEIIESAFPTMSLAALSDRLNRHLSDVVNQPPTVRGLCPLPFFVPPQKAADKGPHSESPVDPSEIKAVLRALERLPRRDGFPGWFPEEIVARAEAPPAK